MAWSSESILLAISAACQFYYASFSATSLYLAMTVTLPEYCKDDDRLLSFMTFLLWFIFLNMMGNFVCIVYKAKLSIVPFQAVCGSDYPNEMSPDRSSYSSSCNVSSIYKNSYEARQQHTERSLFKQEEQSSTYGSSFAAMNNNVTEADQKTVETNCIRIPNEEIDGGWHRCKDCLALSPPRAHHCPLCQHCVLKRDHHCYFVGKCIGFHNQRFFIVFCFYGGMGGLLSLWLASHYLRVHYEALDSWGRIAYAGPYAFLSWLFGYTSGSVCAMVMFLWWSFLTTVIGCVYGIGQIALVKRGQTKWEFLKDQFPYRGKLLDNIHSVFGKYWPIGFFVPAPFLGYVGDGANWDYLVDNEAKNL